MLKIPVFYILFCYLEYLCYLAPLKGLKKIVKFEYHNYESLKQIVSLLNTTKCSGLSRVYSIGKSVQGRDLMVMELSTRNYTSTDFRPAFYYSANIHGNEVVSKEVILHLVDDLCDAYNEKDPYVFNILNSIDLHFLFSTNPDGFEKAVKQCRGIDGRYNARGVDLNRNFPYLDFVPVDPVQPETEAVMQWMKEYYFVFSVGIHGGEVVVAYPYNGDHNINHRYLPTSDNPFIVSISRTFVKKSKNFLMRGCKRWFNHGVVNGAAWYRALNSLHDYVMHMTSGLQVTLELSCCKYPEPDALPKHYDDYKDALLAMPHYALRGVKGRILDQHGNGVSDAVIQFIDGGKPVNSTKEGYFFKNLHPKEYQTFIKFGYKENKTIIETKIEVFDKYEPSDLTIIFVD